MCTERMKSFFPFSILLFALICLPDIEEGVFFYVSPTEPLSSCPGNSSCPPGQLCYTMDYLANQSSKLFSPDQVNITLIFMCGVHNYTKDWTVQNRHSFVMKGAAESRNNVVIDYQFIAQNDEPGCTLIQFFNVSFVNITNLTMRCPSINLQESHIMVKNSNLRGYPGTKETFSYISIAGRGSQALLENCTFRENCFVMSNFTEGIIVSNSTFQSYRHQNKSIITALSSVVTLIGNVNFTDSVTGIPQQLFYAPGTALFLQTTHQEFKSSLNITTGAIVYFINLECSFSGGAICGHNAMVNIGINVIVTFKHNKAITGGALYLKDGMIVFSNESSVIFASNSAFFGGALTFINSTLYVDSTADGIRFYDNKGSQGGAVFLSHGAMYINTNKTVEFTMNTAQDQGGAIYIEAGSHGRPSIIVGNYSKMLLFNNSAFQGGAIHIVPSSFMITVGYQSSIQFINNTAFDIGGAVYSQSSPPCIFMITDYSARISFTGNSAQQGIGHHMFGASIRDESCDSVHISLVNKQGKPHCWLQFEEADGYINISFDPGFNETLSPVSSAPQRVCLCGSNGKPQCANISYIFTNVSVYRGETFILPACVVGYDFGTTVGVIHAGFLDSNRFTRLENVQYNQLVSTSERCSLINYTVYSKYDHEHLQLQASFLPLSAYIDNHSSIDYCTYKNTIENGINEYNSRGQFGCLSKHLLLAPIIINITLLPGCPPGLTLVGHDQTTCSCYPILADNGFNCLLKNKTGLLQWNSTVWVSAIYNEGHSTAGIIYNKFCPLFYCKSGSKTVNIGDDPSKQCASNRTGILCGACMDNLSLGIGSSQCIECPNSNNVALLLAIAAAGVFLVFFILALNLTVTQGLINGIIFYANIVWTYKIIFFPPAIQKFLHIFIAWLNLDFGIETCFFVGLDAYWKTWLQFLFPFYIWAIAGVIIVACRYSSRLTNLIGSRAVPLLATLFLLSYMKLLRTVIDATSVAVIAWYPKNTSYAVWYLDGNLRYCQHPHIYLFVAAVATLVFLWLPYTLLLLFIQPLGRVSHLRPLKWINKLTPVYDAYFSPLKDKHRYWFGSMLLVRGILLVLLTVTSVGNPELNIFVLFLFTVFLLFLMSVKYVYKRMTIRLLQSATLLNLIVLSAGTLYMWESTESKTTLLEVSIGITFAQFCVIVVLSLIRSCLWRCKRNQSYDIVDENIENIDDDITHKRIEDPELEPLIN